MKIKTILATISACILCIPAFADVRPEIELAPGKKIMHVSRMNLPSNLSLMELMLMFPELTARDDVDALSRYDLQINDVSCGTSKYDFFKFLHSCDIEDIEFSMQPTASEQHNGQGGVINVILNTPAEGFSGHAMLEASSAFNVMPAVSLNYKTDELKIFGSVVSQYIHPHSNTRQTLVESSSTGLHRNFSDVNLQYVTQMANFRLEYEPDEHHLLKAWAIQTLNRDHEYVSTKRDSMDARHMVNTQDKLDKFSFDGGLNYKYTFDLGFVETQASFIHNPERYYWLSLEDSDSKDVYKGNQKPFMIDAFTKVCFHLVPKTATRKIDFETGLDVQYTYKLYREDFTGPRWPKYDITARFRPLYLSPFIKLDTRFGDYFLKGSVRYQYNGRNIRVDSDGKDFKKEINSVTATVNTDICLDSGHSLSVTLDKAISRPEDEQIYPYVYYAPESSRFVRGNSALIPENIYTASVDYQYTWADDRQSVTSGAGLKYHHTSEIITERAIGSTTSYANAGKSDIVAFNLTATYATGPFSLTLNSNLYHNWNHIGGTRGRFFSYNLALIPRLSFVGGWRISGSLEYNSAEETYAKSLGDYFYSEFRISKEWDKWNVFMTLTDNFHRQVTDLTYTLPERETKTYNLKYPGLGLGAIFRF
ncbi:MAG: outer membrane beta-barrel family protein [Bacteroidales bacterium]|nr:outer membrane beta-barrel family protein [Bacteroidales bacterium]